MCAVTPDTVLDSVVDTIQTIGEKLSQLAQALPPYTEAYRINDWGEYVSLEDWNELWKPYPDWYPKVWLLCDNGQLSTDDVKRMTLAQALNFFDTDFEPEFAYFTDTGEDGVD